MPVIRFPSRRAHHADVNLVHPTAPRVGIFVKTQRARCTGPQAHQTPYIADEERSTNEKMLHALVKFVAALAGIIVGVRIALALLGGLGL